MKRIEIGIGHKAPLLELPTEDGTIVSIADLRDTAVLVSFLSHAA